MAFLTNGFSSLGSFLGLAPAAVTPTAGVSLPTFMGLGGAFNAPSPRPTGNEAVPVYASPMYASPAWPTYQAGLAAPTCSIDYFSYTTIAPVIAVTRTQQVTKVVNSTIYVPMITTRTVVDVETIILKQGDNPSVVIAQTTNCNQGYPAWQTAVQQPQQYQPVYAQAPRNQDEAQTQDGDRRTPDEASNRGNANYQPYYNNGAPAANSKQQHGHATSTRVWQQAEATPEYMPYPTALNAW